MRNRRVFLVQNGQVFLQDGDGNRLSMELADFERVSGVSFDSQRYICYEPDLPFYDDSTLPNGPIINDVSHSDYDNAIANIAILTSRLANPLYGLTGAKLIAAQNALAKRAEIDAVQAEIDSARAATKLATKTPAEIEAHIDQMFAGASNSAEALEVVKLLLKKIAIYILDPRRP